MSIHRELELLDHTREDLDDTLVDGAPCGHPRDHVGNDHCPWCDPRCEHCGEPWRQGHRCTIVRERVPASVIRRYQELAA